jgi:hypothetical protein
VAINMANRFSSQRLTVISLVHRARRTPTESPVVLEENVIEGLPVPVVTAANRNWKIMAGRTMTPCLPNTHDWSKRKLKPGRDIHVNAEETP